MEKQELIGRKFNNLTIINVIISKKTAIITDCLCDCGQIRTSIRLPDIESGHLTSCGCLSKTGRFQKDTKREIINNFENLTPESSYWAGFIFGDGSVNKNNSLFIGLSSLTEHTTDHLIKLSNFIYGKDYVLKYTTTCILQVANQKLVNNLKQYGIIHNKTYNGTLILPDQYQGDFIRGYFDADGWFSDITYKHKNGRVYPKNIWGLCSYRKDNLEKIIPYLNCDVKIYKKGNQELYNLLVNDRKNILRIIDATNSTNTEICYLRKWNKLWKFYDQYKHLIIKND